MLLARMIGRNCHHQQEISHYSGHLRYQRLDRHNRTFLRARALVDHQGGQFVRRRENDKGGKAKRQNRILRKVERLPRKFIHGETHAASCRRTLKILRG